MRAPSLSYLSRRHAAWLFLTVTLSLALLRALISRPLTIPFTLSFRLSLARALFLSTHTQLQPASSYSELASFVEAMGRSAADATHTNHAVAVVPSADADGVGKEGDGEGGVAVGRAGV